MVKRSLRPARRPAERIEPREASHTDAATRDGERLGMNFRLRNTGRVWLIVVAAAAAFLAVEVLFGMPWLGL